MTDVQRAAQQYQAALNTFDSSPESTSTWAHGLRHLEDVDVRSIPAGALRDLHMALLENVRGVAARPASDHASWSEFIDLVSTMMWISYQLREFTAQERARAAIARAHRDPRAGSTRRRRAGQRASGRGRQR